MSEIECINPNQDTRTVVDMSEIEYTNSNQDTGTDRVH
jgi:hypothetical protein